MEQRPPVWLTLIIAFIFAFLGSFADRRIEHAGRRSPAHEEVTTSTTRAPAEDGYSPGTTGGSVRTTSTTSQGRQLTCVDDGGHIFHTDPYYAKKFGKDCK